MRSLRSKLWEFFLRPIYSKKANASAELNIKLSRTIEAPFPPKLIFRKNQVEQLSVQGRNVFKVVPRFLSNSKIIFYLHGGAYIAGITWPHWRFINKISSQTGVKFAVLDYPIAPENTYIDTIGMALSTYNVLLKDHSPSQIIFMGDSAGGGLALALAQILRKKKLPQPHKMILLCPWLDVSMVNPDIEIFERKDSLLSKKVLITAGKYYANGADSKLPEMSPIYGDFEGLTQTHVFIGTHDILAADARKLNDQLKNTNINMSYYEFDKMFHVWMFFPIPEARDAIRKINEIILSA